MTDLDKENMKLLKLLVKKYNEDEGNARIGMNAITITLDLDEPDTREKVKHMLYASSMQIAIEFLYNDVFRKYLKHRPEDLTDEQYDMIEKIYDECREHFYEFLE